MKKRKTWLFGAAFIAVLVIALFLRFYRVTSYPPSLYWEEIALGYDAFSVLKTGHDHLGNLPNIVSFESYGDYKPALYFYLLIPSIATFGLNEFSVRLPAMIAGVFIVIGVGILARTYTINKRKDLAQILAMFLTAISPWAIQFSRAAWEVNVATCFVVWAVVFGLRAKNWQMRALSFVLFALSMYTYHSTRVIAPFLALGMFVIWEVYRLRKVREFLPHVMVGIFFTLLILPILISLRDPNTKERFSETSLFADGHVVLESNAYQEQSNHSFLTKIFYHRYVIYTKEFIANYLTHFDAGFLFLHGDQNLRHSVQYFGQLYFMDAVFLIIGFLVILKRKKVSDLYLLAWLFIGIVPAALTKATPHALRILPTMPVFLLLITIGVEASIASLKRFPRSVYMPVLLIASTLYIMQFIGFWHFYTSVYPKKYSGAWQYGYRQITEEVNRRNDHIHPISITREMDRPGMAYWFFSQTDPFLVQKIDRIAQRDQGEVLQFQNIRFVNFVSDAQVGVIASTVESLKRMQNAGRNISSITYISDPAGQPIWAVYQLN